MGHIQMKNMLPNIDRMVMIGSTGQNCGKTTLAAKIIKKWSTTTPVIGLKVTTIHHGIGCHRGILSCSICGQIEEGFDLLQEYDSVEGKDTSLLLQAGAKQVFWLRGHENSLYEGFIDFLDKSMDHSIIICESNSLRKFVKPAVFIMMGNETKQDIKPSAAEVHDEADICANGNQDLDEVILEAEVRIRYGKFMQNLFGRKF